MPKNDWENREQIKICRGNKGTISLLRRKQADCQTLREIKFLHREVRVQLYVLPAFFLDVIN